ncbi:MAG: hypothetical protein Q4G49_03195 [Paracoccus sp. (in: a-proteobacteria)]|nr:hypothetical protein [Paracoccus sp. (in: a-proteobacteria)]
MTGPVETARAAWGADLPEWVEALAQECAASSQNRVAQRLDRSGALISQLLRRKYPGDLAAVEELFNAVFRNSRVNCPALGDIAATACRDWRDKARHFENTNSHRVRMYRACHTCPKMKGDTR